jgi:transcriptional regulator with XRE-family HTH domain
MDFGRAIRIARSAHGLTQAQLAQQLKISASQISLLESGDREPSTDVLKGVSRVLKIPLPLLTLLGAEQEDLDVKGDREITDLAKVLLRLLVRVGKDERPRATKVR